MKKIVVLSDSFKQTLSSSKVVEIESEIFRKMLQDYCIFSYPLADGGEGTTKILIDQLKLKTKTIKVHNAFLELIDVTYGYKGISGYFDVASCIGYDVNQGHPLNPLITTSLGVGEIIEDMVKSGLEEIYIGLGGSITNDAGAGLLSALGIDFYCQNQKYLPVGGTLKDLTSFSFSEAYQKYTKIKFKVFCDVTNPLYGENGAAYVFARQKGATLEMIKELDSGLMHFVDIMEKDHKITAYKKGSGAAGGIGYALRLLNAELVSGADKIIELLEVDKIIDNDTIVVTGEGRLDNQSLQGKAIDAVVRMAKRKNAKVILIVGSASSEIISYFNKQDILVFTCNNQISDLNILKLKAEDDLKQAVLAVVKSILNNNK